MAKKSNNFFNLYLRVNDKEATATLNNVGKDLRTLRSYTRNLEEGTEKWQEANKKLAEVEHTYDGMRKRQRELINETKKSIATTEDQTSAMQEFFGSVQETFSSLKNGDFIGAREGFKGIGEGIGLATKAAWKFIATPLGASLAGLAGIALITKKWFDYNVAVSETIKLTEQLTGFDGRRLSQFRASVQATADTFDKDFNEVLKSANTLSNQMKISQEEALDLINQGFVRGADASGDFLDKIKEYPIQFKNAGYSAQDFIDIATQEAKGGVYDDKLLDALKEADLALKEMTNTQKEALENAFGKTFAEEIAVGVKTGEKTTKDAINNIISKSKELNLNYQQQQQIVSDLFKGAGEDAGGFAEIVLQLNAAFDDQNKELNDNEEATQRLVDANIEYEQAMADLFDSSKSGFPAMLTNLKAISKEVTTNILVSLKNMFTSIEQLKEQAGMEGQSQAVRDMLENAKEFGTTVAEEAEIQMEATRNNISRIKKEIENLGWWQRGTALKESLAEQEAYYKELVAIAKNESEALRDYEESIKTPVKDQDSKDDPEKSGNSEDDSDKEAEKRIAKEKAIREKVAATLKEWEEERAIKEELEKFEKDKQAEEREILELENKFAKLEEQANGEKELLARLESEKLQQLQDIREKYAEERREKDLIEKEKLTAQEEKWAAAHEAATIQLEEAKMNAYRMGISNLTSVFDEKTMAFKGMFLFEKGLAAAEVVKSSSQSLAEISAHTAIANAKAVAASPLTGGMPWVAINTATGAKQAATTKINAAMQLANIAATAINGFSEGGDTTPFGLGFRDESGEEVAGIVHTKEYVIPEFVRRDPEVPRIIEYLEDKRVRKLRGYATGGDTTPAGSADPLAPETSFSDPRTNQLLELILEGVTANRDIHFGPEAEMKRQELQKKLENIRSRAKVKKD